MFDNSVHVAIRLSVRQIIARRIHASEVSVSLSQSLLILRYLPSHANVLSTTHRIQRTVNPRSPFGRLKISSAGSADFGAEGAGDALQRSVGLPRRQIVGEHAPGASGAERADDFAQVCLARPAAPFGRREQGLKDAPLDVGEVGIIRLAFGGGGCLGFHVSSLPTCSSFIKHTLRVCLINPKRVVCEACEPRQIRASAGSVLTNRVV